MVFHNVEYHVSVTFQEGNILPILVLKKTTTKKQQHLNCLADSQKNITTKVSFYG